MTEQERRNTVSHELGNLAKASGRVMGLAIIHEIRAECATDKYAAEQDASSASDLREIEKMIDRARYEILQAIS